MQEFNDKAYKQTINTVELLNQQFKVTLPWMVMGEVDPDAVHFSEQDEDDHDKDIYRGTVITPHGYAARVAYHEPTSTLHLFMSKTAVNLRGRRGEDGLIHGTDELLKNSYLVGSQIVDGDNPESWDYALSKLGEVLDEKDHDMGDRASKHFSAFEVEFTSEPVIKKNVDKVHYTHLIGNTVGSVAYRLKGVRFENAEKVLSEKCSANFNASIRRKDGHFVPMSFSAMPGIRPISKVSKPIEARDDGYNAVKGAVLNHYQGVSERFWEQKNLEEDEGWWYKSKVNDSKKFNYLYDNMSSVIPLSLAASAVYTVKPQFGIGITAGFMVAQVAGEKLLHSAQHEVNKGVGAFRAKRKKLSDYAQGADVSHHFKSSKGNNQNPSKVAPKADESLNPEDFIIQDVELPALMRNRPKVVHDIDPEALDTLVLTMHQLGVPSRYKMLDRHTRVDMFGNDVLRLMHKKQDGTMVAFAQYQPESKFCKNEQLRLPKVYQEQFQQSHGIMRIEYKEDNEGDNDILNVNYDVPYHEATREINNHLLFSRQSYVDKQDQERSRDITDTLFTVKPSPHEDYNIYARCRDGSHISKRVPTSGVLDPRPRAQSSDVAPDAPEVG